MSQIDQIKEILGWLKVVFGALVAVDVSLIAWLAQNFHSTDTILVVLAVVAVLVTTVGIVSVNHAAFRRIAQLEKLQWYGPLLQQWSSSSSACSSSFTKPPRRVKSSEQRGVWYASRSCSLIQLYRLE